MKRGLDTNVLISAHIPSIGGHRSVRAFLEEQLASPEVILAITPAVLHEFLHVVTDARRFDPPVPMAAALDIVRNYLGCANVECLATDEAATRLAFDLIEKHRLGHKRLADTLFAATLLSNGVGVLITCNAADYEVFRDLRLIDPRQQDRPA